MIEFKRYKAVTCLGLGVVTLRGHNLIPRVFFVGTRLQRTLNTGFFRALLLTVLMLSSDTANTHALSSIYLKTKIFGQTSFFIKAYQFSNVVYWCCYVIISKNLSFYLFCHPHVNCKSQFSTISTVLFVCVCIEGLTG